MSLLWVDHRWHLDGRGIHAGTTLEIKLAGVGRSDHGGWQAFTIESQDSGGTLVACHRIGHLEFTCVVADRHWPASSVEELRWPKT